MVPDLEDLCAMRQRSLLDLSLEKMLDDGTRGSFQGFEEICL